jgi:hypothetical protein
MGPRIFITYCSPANSNCHVAEVIESAIIQLSGTIYIADLAELIR